MSTSQPSGRARPMKPAAATAKPEAKKTAAKKTDARPAIAPEKLVAQVAKATRLRGAAAEPRQSGKRHVITLTDEAGTRILAYVDPLKRGGFRVLVQNYGGQRAVTVANVAAAAKEVKTSARRSPKVTKAAAKKAAAEGGR